MQNNSPPNEQRSPKSPPPKPQRSPSLNSPYPINIKAARMQDLPSHPPNQRFSLTPQNVGTEVRSPLNPTGQYSEQPQETTMQATGVQGKSYAKQEPQQLTISGTYGSPSPSYDAAGELNNTSSAYPPTEQSNYAQPAISGSRTSGPLSPPIRFPFFGTSFMASTQQTLKSPGQLGTNMSPPTTPTNDRQCAHPSNETPPMQEIPTAYYDQQVQKFRSGSDLFVGDAAKINGELNEVFLKRLRDIDIDAQGDNDLKLITYQEWVDMLLKINESIISNMEQLEADVAERLEFLQRRVTLNCRHSQGNELMKCRKDIDTLVKFIQHACHYDMLEVKGMAFETMTLDQVFGLTEHQLESINAEGGGLQMRNASDPESVQRNKLLCNMKALALEVADKHDEVRELKRQVVCMEDEIQKAQKKIQFKDDVIKELRNDLKRNAKPTSPSSPEACLGMPPINLDTARSDASTLVSEGNQLRHYLDDGSSQFESLSHNEHVEQEKLKILDDELNELFEINKQFNKQQMEKHRLRLSEIFHKSESEKTAAYSKLDFMRRQLIDLETSGVSAVEGDCDSGFSSKNSNDQDAKILESVRKRLRNLNEYTFELKRRVHKLELENNELSTSLQSEKTFSQRNSETLKNVADLLGNMTGAFSYTDMYSSENNQCDQNPFCEAIMEIKRRYQEREERLLRTVGLKNQKIEELTQALIDHEKIFGQQQRQRLNISESEDIDNITPPATLTAPMPHRQTSQPQKPHPQ